MEDGPGPGPVCVRCNATSSLMWNRSEDGSILCLECHGADKNASKSANHSRTMSSETPPPNGGGSSTPTHSRRTRMKDRAAKARQAKAGEKQRAGSNNHGGGGVRQKGRRTLAKQLKQPAKAPKSQVTVVTSDSILHKGTIYEVGDVVSVLDTDGGVYYAVIRGFLQDQYAKKHAILTWLLPTHPNPTHFDPRKFVLGPEEDSPTLLDFLEFVCHSPQSRLFHDLFRHNLEKAELWRGAVEEIGTETDTRTASLSDRDVQRQSSPPTSSPS